MDKVERVIQIIIQGAVAFAAVVVCAKLCTGCALVERAVPKEKVAEAIRTAYAEGGRDAVSNRIEKLVVSGELSRKQADRIHVLAQGVYAKVLEKLDAEVARECLACQDR